MMTCEQHDHPQSESLEADENDAQKATSLEESSTVMTEEEEGFDDNEVLFIKSRKGKDMLQYNGFRYRKAYKAKSGTRWVCSLDKNCNSFLYLNDEFKIVMACEQHDHPEPHRFEDIDSEQNDTALVITSRKGKEMLLFRQYTYRKQYIKGDRTRWVCSTIKNCRACVFTDTSNYITSAYEEHCHEPPKYYLKPQNVIEALREPLIIEAD